MPSDNTLRLQTNVPETIALEYGGGLTVNGKFGDQVMFTLSDGRKLYLAPFVAQKIADAGIRAGEVFTLCKREITQGNRRMVEYEINAAVPAEQSTAVSTRTVTSSNNGTSNLTRGTIEARTTATVAVMPKPAPAAEMSDPSATPAAVMKLAGIAAVDAVLAIEEYARARGMTDFMFGADNLQRIAVSLYIDMRKGGRA